MNTKNHTGKGLLTGVYDKYIDDVQELLDMGYNNCQISRELSICRKKVSRVIKKHNLETYVPFDEMEYLYNDDQHIYDPELMRDKSERLILSVLDSDLIIYLKIYATITLTYRRC
ncbi:hypothetical protein [Bacillus sp. 03113]|uniref:hypothetical protein n=1 Tax=Bacillus sp. 03113 TaxID=2578211 RepID=UPI0015E87EDF|nr:hypothetical protein [Bacillus sp. 03113]